MNLLLIQETDWLQRGPHQQHHLLERMAARGHTVTVLDFPIDYTPFPRGSLWGARQVWEGVQRTNAGSGVRVIRPGFPQVTGLSRIASMATFAREIHRQRPDLILNYALSTGLPALLMARQMRIPFLFHVIDALPTLIPQPRLRILGKMIEAILLRRADHSLFINEQLRKYGISHGARIACTSTIRSGVDLNHFLPRTPNPLLRAQLGWEESDVVLFFMGYLYSFAGLDRIMRLLPELPARVKMLMVGAGEAFDSLQQLREDLNLGARVAMTGRQPYATMPDWLSIADVCLLHSDVNEVMRDIVPIKLYEYMASGKPVLASQLPGVMADVPDGNGVLYADSEQLLTTVQGLLDKVRRVPLGKAARLFTEQHCDWEILTDQFAELLARVAKG